MLCKEHPHDHQLEGAEERNAAHDHGVYHLMRIGLFHLPIRIIYTSHNSTQAVITLSFTSTNPLLIATSCASPSGVM